MSADGVRDDMSAQCAEITMREHYEKCTQETTETLSVPFMNGYCNMCHYFAIRQLECSTRHD